MTGVSMQIDPGNHRSAAPPASVPAPPRAGAVPALPSARAGLAGVPPGSRAGAISDEIPPEVLAQVTAAARCAEELARNNRELHFRPDEHSNRIIIEVRDMSGNVLRTIPPSQALDAMTTSPGERRWLA